MATRDRAEKTDPRAAAEAFAGQLTGIYGESLVSVLLYGSAARGDFRVGISDVNVLVILRSLDLAQLRRASKVVAAWAEQGNPPPLMLTDAEWRASADVFPIEYSDIRDSHAVLAGSDPFGEMIIRREHLRFRLEHELRSKKIQLREGLLSVADAQQLGGLLLRSLPSFLTLFRALLRLAGEAVPLDPVALVQAVGVRAGFGPEAVLEVVRSRDHPADFAPSIDGSVPAGYLAAIERTTEWLDSYRIPPDAGAEV
jgi:hypothetical protein